MKKYILLLLCSLALDSCILKKWKDIKAEYQHSTEASIDVWYQTESQSLITKRNDGFDEAYVKLPTFNGAKDLTVALKESIVRIEQDYDTKRQELDSLYKTKLSALKLKSK